MKNILIASFDLEVGGVERSLINMLNNFDYKNYDVDLMLYSHTGEFMKLLPSSPFLLEESKSYKTFRMSIKETVKSGEWSIALARLLAKFRGKIQSSSEDSYQQMQYMWKYSMPFLPKSEKEYDVAISFLWPHYFVAKKVKAKKKIAWVHTDYSTIQTNIKIDLEMWNQFDYIAAVSEECGNAFISKYPSLEKKVIILENILTSEIVENLAKEELDNPMLHDDRFKLLTVARLSHAKGIDHAVKAFKQLKDRGYDNIAWYVVGYGSEEKLLRDLIAKYGLGDSFVLLGKKNNPYPYINASDLYVQPSRYEGKAVTVTEAKMLGKPILITNYPTAKSQLDSGVDGVICPMGVDGIVEGIKMLIDDVELRMKITNNVKRTNYSNETELEKLYKIVNQ
ncbi:glycosyltransferase [Gottfriedia solisilvae]|uniref:glycosyltransferase n=1 Tax=Gottfriedia solisilvae TaxID=1516104 RepID=UPI003D2F2EE9